MTRGIPCLLLGVGLAFGLAVAGCGKSQDGTPADPPTGGPPAAGGPPTASAEEVLAKLPGGAEHAVGKKVYADNNCARCHKLGETGGAAMSGMSDPPGGPGGPGMGRSPGGPGGPGMGGRPGMGGPDLTKTGAAADHTKDWLAAHVRDPKTHRQRSSMPPSGPDKISDADLDKLAAYLAGQK